MSRAAVSALALLVVAAAGAAQAAPAPGPSRDEKARIQAACDAHQPACDPMALLGSYEQKALGRALAARHLTIEHAPWGKVLRRIHVVNYAVFGPEEGALRLLNVFHRTTREDAVRREVLLRPGDEWKQSLVDQTARKLRDPLFSAVVVVVPVETGEPGTVDLLVVTRDVWSLRLNSNWEVQSGKFTYLTLSLSENNFLGWRKLTALVFSMDQGAYSVGPAYLDKNLAGKKLQLTARGGLLFNRGTSKFEGSLSKIDLSRPLWSLDSKWGAGVTWQHSFAIARSFLGTQLRTYDAPETPGDDMVPWQYHDRTFSLTTSVVRQFPGRIEHQIRLGHTLASQRPSLYDPIADPVVRAAFERDVLPRSERSSQVFVNYSLFTPRYRTYHDVDSYDLAEDTQLGPNLSVTAGVAWTGIGSERNFAHLAASASYTVAFGDDGLGRLSLSTDDRLDDDSVIDNLATGMVRVVTPTFAIGRVVAQLDASTRWRETQNRFLSAGGDNGLRGFIIGEFTGQRRAVGHVELRTLPLRVSFTRVGAVAFWDSGGAADTFRSMGIHNDVGIGLRILVPQTSPSPMRFDWSVALDGGHAGFPGRFIAGYDQAF